MSSEATSWVLNHSTTKGTDRLVLLVLANHCGRAGDGHGWECYPGVERIARQAGIDRVRTVQTALARLVEQGAIERVLNGAPDERVPKHKRTNLYRVLIDDGECGDRSCRTCGVSSRAERGDASRQSGVTPGDTPRGDAERHPKPERETSAETEGETNARAALFDGDETRATITALADSAAAFGEFWTAYPRHVERKAAVAQWAKAIETTDPQVIIDGAKRYADEMAGAEARFVKHPHRWLRDQRWLDEPGSNRGRRAPAVGPGERLIQDRTPGVKRLQP